jgi:putative endonuclease
MHAQHLALGRAAEESAAQHLQAHGLHMIERNYRSAHGEIDLIMRDDELLVFVEVRYRKTQRYGRPAETVTRSKQRKLIVTAQHYLLSKQIPPSTMCRFDVIGIFSQTNDIEWIQDAFELSEP